jgi:hypothetical protein
VSFSIPSEFRPCLGPVFLDTLSLEASVLEKMLCGESDCCRRWVFGEPIRQCDGEGVAGSNKAAAGEVELGSRGSGARRERHGSGQ